MSFHRLQLAGLVLISTATMAQTLPVPLDIQRSYQKEIRTTEGRPGKNYWQNSADYSINVNYNPDTRLVSGTLEIDYVNNSPDTLTQIWFKLYPNLYKKGSQRISRINAADLSDGVAIDSFWANNKLFDASNYSVDGTNMTLNRITVMNGKTIRFRINYHYVLNKGSHVRTGEVEPGAAFLAYFFPRVAVYDDIDGWNRYPYLGTQEFYNDFCNFDSYISVPKNYVVWATGDLLNCGEVFTPKICQRILQAERNDAIINIIDSADDKGNITANREWNTWHFKAEHVTDFAFATSDHYIWQSSSVAVDPKTGRRTRVDAVFNPKHKDYAWVAPDARKTVEVMSYVFPKWPFPYSHITVFDGLDQMEYPMMVNDNPVESRFDEVTLTDHEIFHTMFPFCMGINETKYAWMDEGWATIGEWLVSPFIDSTIVDEYGVLPTERHLGNEADLPIMALSTELNAAYFTNSYPEPAMGYLFVKDYLGDSIFTKALHHYISEWNGKHPMPFDFFNCMNKGSGKNLDWFWKKWFFDGGYADLAITSVTPKLNAYKVVITSKGTKPVPIDLTITYLDKTTGKVHKTIEVWQKGATEISVAIAGTKKIMKVELGSTWIPDADKSDNVFEVK
jgi:hypothetical protein